MEGKNPCKNLKKHPTRQNLDGYKKDYAKARRTISEAKRQSWRAYVSTLNNNTSAKHTDENINRYCRNAGDIVHCKIIARSLSGKISKD